MYCYEETLLEGEDAPVVPNQQRLFSSGMGSNFLNDSGNGATGSVELFATGDNYKSASSVAH